MISPRRRDDVSPLLLDFVIIILHLRRPLLPLEKEATPGFRLALGA